MSSKTLIEELVAEGFFADWKTLAEVQDALETRGRNFKQPALSPALLALTQDKALERSRRRDGKREIWVYRRFAK